MTWNEGVLFGFDTETTGIDVENDRIVSAAIVIDDGTSEREVYTYLANPGIEIAIEATAVHGITNEYAQEHGQPAEVVIKDILTRMQMVRETYGAIPLVMVNAPYDLTILDREIRRYNLGDGLQLDSPIIDTLACDRMIVDMYRSGRRSLSAASAAYGIAIRGAHTADGDVICSIRLARAMAEKYPWFANKSLSQLQTMQRIMVRQWALHFEEYRQNDGEPDFKTNSEWPYIAYDGSTS
jgi:DNA polymerase-3 subunit epsilon